MKKVFIVVVTYIAVSCIAQPVNDPRIESIWFDGCEYLMGSGSLTHKGNCLNPQHER